jgi:hypothetical protein
MNRILSRHTGQPIERIQEDTERDRFMSSDEAVAYGLIDKVLSDRTVAVKQSGCAPRLYYRSSEEEFILGRVLLFPSARGLTCHFVP